MDRPFVFIGSSSEKDHVARAIQANLDRACETQVWSQGVFDGSLTPIFQTLVGELRRYDFAIIVLAADDVVVSRGVSSAMPRDNLLFELGLFIGALGTDRTVAVVDRSVAAKLPSDLLGIHPLSYEPPTHGNWQSALGTACDRILQKLQKLPALPQDPEVLRRLRAHWQRHAELYPDCPNPERFKLYSFFGLCDEPDAEPQEPDVEHVYHLWADAAAGSTISAAVRRDDGPARFRVRFDNQDAGHAGNVAFRIDGRNLLYRAGGFRTLRFQARIPGDLDAGDLREVQLGIRLVDALGTHWIHALREGYRPLFVAHADGAPWADCAVDLADRRTTSWKVFEQDGNSLYHGDIPDFTMLLAVVVEVGRRQAIRPGPGRGVVELRSSASNDRHAGRCRARRAQRGAARAAVRALHAREPRAAARRAAGARHARLPAASQRALSRLARRRGNRRARATATSGCATTCTWPTRTRSTATRRPRRAPRSRSRRSTRATAIASST